VFPLLAIFRRLGGSERRAWAATLLTLASPLFWTLAIRPLSDLVGLGVALLAQALLLTSLREERSQVGSSTRSTCAAVAAALLAGLGVGFRSQTVWLTVPLLALCGARCWRQDRVRAGAMAAAFSLGVLVWALPLLIATRGLERYLDAFASQAAEQWHDEGILAASLRPAHLARVLATTLVSPFANVFVGLVAVGFGLLGLAVKMWRGRDGVKWIAVMYGPYLLFHVMFQDPNDARYALPITPALAYLIVRGLDLAASRFMPWMVAALIGVCLSIAVPPVVVYAQNGNPVFRALADVEATVDHGTRATDRPVLAMHHSVSRMLRGQRTSLQTLPSIPKKEWRALVNYWRSGGDASVWFLAERERTDLALIDKAARRVVRRYDWPFANRGLMTSARPRGLLWYEIRPPGWMVDEGWALTPETGGVAFADRRGPSERPIHAFIRRRSDALTLLIGGRTSVKSGDPAARITVRLDGVVVDSWLEENRAFLRTWRLPAGRLNGTGQYAAVDVAADAADAGGPRPTVVVDQFDAQDEGSLLYGLLSGWYELEIDPATARSWRWTDRDASLRIHPGDGDVIVRLNADSPLTYLRRPPQIVVRAGDEILDAELTDSGSELTVTVRVPRARLERGGGIITIQTVAAPDQFKQSDRNRPFPGLRVFDVTVESTESAS
jgi:hypothetical protein